MTAPFNTLAVIEQFLYSKLSGDPVLATLMPPGAFYPRYSPNGVAGIHVIYQFIGPDGGRAAIPMGQGIGMMEVDYVLTAWNPGQSLQALAPVTMRIQEILTGPALRGANFVFTDSFGTGWVIWVRYGGPGIVAPETNPAWQPSADIYRINLRQNAA
jgi:hypothetical protein